MAYDGPDASEYYTLKDPREEGKECLKKLEEQKQRELEIHRLNVESVRATYKALTKERRRRKKKKRKRRERRDKKGKKESKENREFSLITLKDPGYLTRLTKGGKWVPHGYIESKLFDLYSVDYIENYYCEDNYHYWKYVEFYEEVLGSNSESSSRRGQVLPSRKKQMIEGHVYASPDYNIQFPLFRAPARASLKKYWSEELEEGGHKIGVQFLAEDCVRMLVGRDIIKMMRRDPLPDNAPDVFEFVGITRGSDKRKTDI
ncbi:uncharacterized protein F4817DRAFT_365161 [Daldinia loculata]|uniref:uncharacterized protein n=1 Tax=Daldinia loculata TaxID=103429 RepID=UPI0020C2324E|nr:uncharacterized protein F4817DRAFT_365161 [Daldinia loculata]KAI1647703.1 hypothetical protein F4817DRAFT_365161 [Daldinia loculata]